MPSFICASTNQPITLTQQIARSGEGEVWKTNLQGMLAKIYHSPDEQRIRKLEVMLAHPPQDPNAGINHISFAFPKSLLKDASGRGVGFLMPEISASVQLLDVYNPLRRQRVLPGFNWLYLHTTAMNIASIIGAIHQVGYVIGDIKSENILVNNRALPAIIDTDSFQVRNPKTGEIFHCRVGSEGFTPVELMGQDLELVEQTQVHDRFRLGVIIYLLLFGDYPFKGKWIGAGDSPPPSELLRQGFWCYAPHSLVQPGPLSIPLDIVHPELQQCFLRCFNSGHKNPELRPSPADWIRALQAARSELGACKKVKNHWYSKTYGRCYWCDRKANLGIDIFPSVITSSQKAAIKTFRKAKAPIEQLAKRINFRIPRTKSVSPQTIKQTVKRTAQTIKSQLATPTFQAPTSSTQTPFQVLTSPIQTPSTAPTNLMNWKGLGSAIGALAGVFVLLIFLSRSKVDPGEIELTAVGGLLCLGLVAIGYLWLKVIDRYNL